MGTSQDLSAARWRKSSYSGDTGGDCVEVAAIAPRTPLTPHIAIRDSKAPDLGALTLTPEAFAAFVNGCC
ncbi:DUF397 domain-containing protein [Streptomyces sp. NPDC002680]|uniref:DUF397 domain-containing protein n=1 Tax=Streptomyces sp. NPDC002680 TaxID=3364659 RepID=UPI0036BD82A2